VLLLGSGIADEPETGNNVNFIRELRERRVLTTAAIYVPVVWVVVEVLTFLFDKFSAPAWADDLAAAAFVAGFPVALLLSWIFEFGPDGLSRTPPGSKKGLATLVCAVLMMAIGTAGLFSLIYPINQTPVQTLVSSESTSHTLAVFPFENLSEDGQNVYFAKGLSAELISRLSRINDLRVTSVTLSKQELVALGREPDVAYTLEGTVRIAGDRARISAVLFDRASGFTLWSDTFDGELKDVLGLQEKTALQIAQALNIELSPTQRAQVARRDTQSVQAYDDNLRGWALIESLHVNPRNAQATFDAAQRHFQSALATEPGNAKATAGMAMVNTGTVIFGLGNPELLERAQALALEAIELDNGLAESHFALASALSTSGNFEQAIAQYQTTLELDPQNGYAWCELSGTLSSMRPSDPIEAELAARNAVLYRPVYPIAHYALGKALQLQGRLDEAIEAYQQSLELSPSLSISHQALGAIYLDRGAYAQAVSHWEKTPTAPRLLVNLGAAYEAAGDRAQALATLERAFAGGYADFDALARNEHLASLVDSAEYRELLQRHAQ